MNIDKAIETIMNNGPNRIIVDVEGLGVPTDRAIKEYNEFPDIIFIRDDGWTLGAPARFERVAYEMWKDSWTHFIRRPNVTPIPISDY